MADDDVVKTALWQFNEAVSLLREAREHVAPASSLLAEIDEGLPAIQAALEALAAGVAAGPQTTPPSPVSTEPAATSGGRRDVPVAVERGLDDVAALQQVGVDSDVSDGDVGLGDDPAKRSHTRLCDPMTRALGELRDGPRGVVRVRGPQVLWEQDTRPTDGDPAKSYMAPPLLNCPPGTRVRVVAAPTSQEPDHG